MKQHAVRLSTNNPTGETCGHCHASEPECLVVRLFSGYLCLDCDEELYPVKAEKEHHANA